MKMILVRSCADFSKARRKSLTKESIDRLIQPKVVSIKETKELEIKSYKDM